MSDEGRDADDRPQEVNYLMPSKFIEQMDRRDRMLTWAFITAAAAFVLLAATGIYVVHFVDANNIVERLVS